MYGLGNINKYYDIYICAFLPESLQVFTPMRDGFDFRPFSLVSGSKQFSDFEPDFQILTVETEIKE